MMAATELTALVAQKTVDARGTSCPGPILAAKKGIVDVKVGEIMAVLSTDTGTKKDLPAWANKMGHEFLGVLDEQGYFKCYIKRMK